MGRRVAGANSRWKGQRWDPRAGVSLCCCQGPGEPCRWSPKWLCLQPACYQGNAAVSEKHDRPSGGIFKRFSVADAIVC